MKTAKLQILTAARELLADPAHWTKGYFARVKTGGLCSWGYKEATCWCSLGAIRKGASKIRSAYGVLDAITLLADVLDPKYKRSVAEFNDDPNTRHKDVLALFDRAISKETQ